MQSASGIAVEESGQGIVQIRLDRPERLNALGVDMVDALQRAIADAIARPARVLLIRGTGRAFCAGADLKERQGMEPAARTKHNRAINAAVDALGNAPMPTICVINGLAMGGGCEIALACDFRYAAQDAQLGLPEIRLGIIPGAGGTQRLPRLIGLAKARDMIFTGRHVGADEALEIGLVDRTMAPAEAYPVAFEEARKFAEGPTAAYAAAKRALQASLGGDLAPGLEVEREVFVPLFSTHDQEEGMRAFLEKREPRFEGR